MLLKLTILKLINLIYLAGNVLTMLFYQWQLCLLSYTCLSLFVASVLDTCLHTQCCLISKTFSHLETKPTIIKYLNLLYTVVFILIFVKCVQITVDLMYVCSVNLYLFVEGRCAGLLRPSLMFCLLMKSVLFNDLLLVM